MAKPERIRPKAGEPSTRGARRSKPAARPSSRVTPKGSNRYTPPIPKEMKVSPRWVPVLMFTLLVLGMVVIVANYLELLPGDAKNTYLFLGLGFITAGFITATRYR